jgi:isopenicillin N synthase-like dioxygenase
VREWTIATTTVPTIDIGPLLAHASGTPGGDPLGDPRDEVAVRRVADRIGDACSRFGFLQIVGHGIDPRLRSDLQRAAAEFFALEYQEKDRIAMRHGGRAWRGWFPLGGELTSGVPDDKEGLYFGTELPADDPAVAQRRPLHGPNLFPERPAELRPLVLEWMERVTEVGRAVLSGIALSLELDRDWFDRWCAEPTVLFRIFHYPPPPAGFAGRWGVAEHTDYGLLTLLAQDSTGGLEVRVGDDWIEVPPTEDAIVCNLGDMLERASGGRFVSTAHRVRIPPSDRYSFPLFLDPSWDAVVEPLPGVAPGDAAAGETGAVPRWDGASVFDVQGTYGEYLVSKVSRVFPDLYRQVVGDPDD